MFSRLKISQERMGTRNHSTVTEFLLLGLTDQPELQLPLFCLFLGIYTVTVVGNLGMISIIRFSSQLHTPMYHFLSSLSLVDLCYSSVITPKDAGRAFMQGYSYLLFWMHDSAIFFLYVCHF
ncbi:Hypothetical predicted protein [Lynx pardinus]|uniref:G-protein coupled receptors family 1 profile domain-containing protein n=1 Tax=Lynx pardinus TaxID=191816 RepID=A0A485P531_LYNPA|nr:Hypothetical predicted protein [Lynx pardinus]